MNDRLFLWSKRFAGEFVDKLRKAYADQDLASQLVFGDEIEARLRAFIHSSIDQLLGEMGATLVGLDAEMRRARDVLQVDWERKRFGDVVKLVEQQAKELFSPVS